MELQKIYFRKSRTGNGYGRMLFESILDHVQAHSRNSCSRIWLDVLKSNTTAQKFYASRGFQKLGEIPFKTDLAEIGMVVLAR